MIQKHIIPGSGHGAEDQAQIVTTKCFWYGRGLGLACMLSSRRATPVSYWSLWRVRPACISVQVHPSAPSPRAVLVTNKTSCIRRDAARRVDAPSGSIDFAGHSLVHGSSDPLVCCSFHRHVCRQTYRKALDG
jgi:hypothetical protein